MSTNFRNWNGVDWDDLFEPEVGGNGAGDGNYRRSDGSIIRYAALQYGSKIPDVGYGRSGGAGDVSTMWAGKGTVAYLINPPTFNGIGDFHSSDSCNWTDRLISNHLFTIYPNGTWMLWKITSNFYNDQPNLYDSYITYPNYPNGLTIATGNWHPQPGPDYSGIYCVDASLSNFQFWWRDCYVFNNGNIYTDHFGTFNGPGTVQYNGGSGMGSGLSLLGSSGTNNLSVGVFLQGTGNSGNVNYKDANGVVRWLNSGTVTITIRRIDGQGQGVTGTIPMWNNCSWQSIGAPPAGSGGGGGGGGGGGCVTVDSFMANGGVAADYVAGFDSLTVTDPYTVEFTNSVVGGVLQSAPENQPCVLIRTANGAELECSTTAPIPTETSGYVLAPDLLGRKIPTALLEDIREGHTEFEWSEVVEVKPIGNRLVQKLFVADRCFWASKDGRRFILHHNLKMAN